MIEEVVEKGRAAGRRMGWRSWFLALLLVAACVFGVLHWADVRKFAALLATARPVWLLAAAASQIPTYLALAIAWAVVLKAAHDPRPPGKLLALTMTKHFADQMVPTAGVSGNVVVIDRLTTLGADRENAMAAVLLSIVGYYASYIVVALAALAFLWLQGGVTWFVLALISVFLVIAAAIPGLTFFLQSKGERAVPGWLRRFGPVHELFELIGDAPDSLVRSRRLIVLLSLLNFGSFLADGLTMQLCLFALGVHVKYHAAFVAFAMASIVVTVAPIPMGLGSFEAVSVATLRGMGVPFEAAISGTLLFRGLTLWLPLLPGLISSHFHLRRKGKDQPTDPSTQSPKSADKRSIGQTAMAGTE